MNKLVCSVSIGVLISISSLASAQGAYDSLLSPSRPGAGKAERKQLNDRTLQNESEIKQSSEIPTVPPPKSGYPLAADTQGISLGDLEDDVRRKAIGLGFRLSAEKMYLEELGLPKRPLVLVYTRKSPVNGILEELEISFTSVASRAFTILRTQYFNNSIQQPVVVAELQAKYGNPSYVSKDGISDIRWVSDKSGTIFRNAGNRCMPLGPRHFATNGYYGSKDIPCSIAISAAGFLDINQQLIRGVRIQLTDWSALIEDRQRIAELIQANQAAEFNRASKAAKPKF